TTFEIINEVLKRNARAAKAWCSVHNIGVADNHRLCHRVSIVRPSLALNLKTLAAADNPVWHALCTSSSHPTLIPPNAPETFIRIGLRIVRDRVAIPQVLADVLE